MKPKLNAINLYPIKSLQGISLPHAEVTGMGLKNDRRWVVTDAQGQFLSQRSHPKMATIQTQFQEESLVLQAPHMPRLDLSAPDSSCRLRVQIWDDSVTAAEGSKEAAAWFSDFLGTPCQLAFMDKSCERPILSPRVEKGHLVSFADGYPLLIASVASLELLNSKLKNPVPVDRFRANLIVSDCSAHAEDSWPRFRIGKAVFRGVKPCSRCSVPTVDQSTGEVSADQEPLRTLNTYRRQAKGVMFGMNLVVETPGKIMVGDTVEIFS